MTTTIDTAGRVVIPKAVRDLAGLQPGTELQVEFRNGRVELHPPTIDVSLQERDGDLFLTVPDGSPVLTHEQVNQIITELREPSPRRG